MWRENTLSMRSEQGGEERSELLIDVQQMSKIYNEGRENEVRALDNISLSVRWGEFLCILGQSGSGKSTLMNILGCLDTASSGNYKIAGENVAGMTPDQLASLRSQYIGFIFQRYNLLSTLSAEANVELPAIYSGLKQQARLARADQLLADLDLGNRTSHLPSELSGGQQQRVLLARALCAAQKMLLLDEPVSGLDPAAMQEMYQIIADLNREKHMTILMVSHDIEASVKYASHILHMGGGLQFFGSKTDYVKTPLRASFRDRGELSKFVDEAVCSRAERGSTAARRYYK